MQFQASPVFHLPLRSGNLMKWILTWNIRQNSSFHSMLLNGVSNEYSQTQPDVLILFFIYLLPKKRKCSITSHTEMYCLRKKNIFIYFFHLFFIFFFIFLSFFSFFGNTFFFIVSIIFHQKTKTVFYGHGHQLLPCPDNLSPPL